MGRIGLIAGLLLALFIAPVLAQKPGNTSTNGGSGERILNFASDIVVETNGYLIITETITVRALGRDIRRGITRDFPTRYRDRQNNQVRVNFDVLEILRDGAPEPWHSENIANGVRLFIGDADVFLSGGQYTYTIRYHTSRQLGFFEAHDELYFNVTGHGWDFPIDQAEVTVHLPIGAEALEVEAFTGAFGANGQAFEITARQAGLVSFRSTSGFAPREGLTIAVAWPKGFVTPPSVSQKAGFLFGDNASLLIAFLGFLGAFAYYHWAWTQVGKDPASGTIIPLFEPPEGFTPAAIRFVDKMKFDQKAFTAAIINMAVKGFLTIEEERDVFRLIKASGDKSILSDGERVIADKLLRTRSSIELKNAHHAKFSAAVSGLKKSIRREFEAAHFKRNSQFIVPGIAAHIIVVILMAFASLDPFATLISLAWLSGAGVFAGLIGFGGYDKFSHASSSKDAALGVLLMILAVLTLGAGTLFFVAGAAILGVPTIILATAMALLSPIYYELLKAPTRRGRKVMDEIEGFKLYLSVAEKHRMEAFHPPEKTPELFEKHLPYALALDVENKWSEQFDDVLKAAAAESQSTAYHPIWYHGNSWHRFGAAGFAGAISSSVTSSIASAATAPGSSSGVGGGGFSGGGGGGGGGGGW